MNRIKTSLVTGGVSAFNNVTFIGDLTLKSSSSSAIIDVNSSYIRVNVDGKDSILHGISQITPINVDNIIVKSNSGGVINGGSGFYTNILQNSSSIHLIGHPASLLLSFKNGSTNMDNNNTTTQP